MMIDPVRSSATGIARLRENGATFAAGTRSAGAAFQVAEDGGAEAVATGIPLADASPVSLGVMLAAEALDRDATRDRAARRHGQVVLTGLAAVQRALLEGGDTVAALERLAGLVAEMPEAAEPRLAALLGMIVLRARVELARLGR
jgi:Class II flagellar assembly regulator